MTVVLLEGVSDVVAVATLAQREGVDLAGVNLVDMHGVTNVGRYVREFRRERLAGLCDAGEERFFIRAIEREGLGENVDRASMASIGFFLCERDLEDELIRALGIEATERVIESEGQLEKLRVFQNQPFQRTRTPEQQLRRFFGTTGGRKEQYARALVEALVTVPEPLVGLIEFVKLS